MGVVMFHNIIMLLSKPPAGFYHAQSQIIPETQYLTHTCPTQPAGGVVLKSRGLRCSSAFNSSKRSSVKINCTVFGHQEPHSHAATPRSLKVLIELCTV